MNEKYEDIRIHFNQIESIVTGQEFFQKQILDQVKELRNEREHISSTDYTDQPPMDLSKDVYPSPDQDSNGCLDGESNEIKNDQIQMNILKEIKETAKKPVKSNSSTLHHKANQGDMNKSSNTKTAPNAEQVPGSPESAMVKNRNRIRDYIPRNLEKNEFWADPQIKKSTVPTIIKDPKTGRELVNIEEHEFEANDDYNYKPSKSAKKRMRKRRITDAKRAKSEVVIHGLEETIYEDDDELYWLSEAKKFIKFTEELSPDYLGEKDGIEITLDDINVTNRILVWTGKHDENNPLPMVVQLKDEDTANAVLRAMFAAGCYNRQVHVKRGKYKKTGDKKTDKEKDDAIEKLKGCYGRPSTTKAERDAARKKKEYLASQVFQKKKTFQEFKQEREVKFANIRAKYTIDKTNGTKDLIKKPKISSKNNPGTGNEADENDEELIENFNPLTHNWYIGDYCRVMCDFDGLVHEAEIKKQYRYDPNVFKVLILGYGIREVKNVNIFEQSRGQKARRAQYENNNNNVSANKISETKVKKAVSKFVDKIRGEEDEEKDDEIPPP